MLTAHLIAIVLLCSLVCLMAAVRFFASPSSRRAVSMRIALIDPLLGLTALTCASELIGSQVVIVAAVTRTGRTRRSRCLEVAR